MIYARCPGSCGELIQGWIKGGEKLISYGINCYSHVTIEEGSGEMSNIPVKAYQMLEKVFRYYGVPQKELASVKLNIFSEIPKGKGMASSTADLAATALAAATLLGKDISESQIGALCVDIEPTDSTLFSQMTLYDPLKGGFEQSYGAYPKGKVLLLEGKQVIDTIAFRRSKNNRGSLLLRQAPELNKALQMVKEGTLKGDLGKIAAGATISAIANQPLLYKVQLEQLLELSLGLGARGVNVAHSGSVVGILHEGSSFDEEKFLFCFREMDCYESYQAVKSYELVAGGAVIIE